MRTRDLLSEDEANLVLKYGFEVADAETFITSAPLNLVLRVARDASKIDLVTIWETDQGGDGWALTMPNTVELMSAWRADWLATFVDDPEDT